MRFLITMIILSCIASGLSQLEQRKDETATRLKQELEGRKQRNTRQAGSCRGPDGRTGTCKPLANCASLLNTLKQNQRNQDFINFLKTSNQICGNAYSVVCCPLASPFSKISQTESQVRLPTIADGCGIKLDESGVKRIEVVGGLPSALGAWPWIALLGYRSQATKLPFKCGGTLITNRHVLTAAHCIKNDLTFIRLGEHDLGRDNETRHIDIPVSKVLKHKKFSLIDGRNDIALVYLARPVQFTDKVTPICLPSTPPLLTRSFVDSEAHIAGWGRLAEGGGTATLLQQLQITVYANEVCRDLYRKNNKLVSAAQFDESVICAGDVRGGKDSCEGDSGGPLMTHDRGGEGSRYYLIGVISYGIGCARTETPGVYARVVNFLDWIQNGIADNA